jgi:hypothetical protein
MESASPGLFWVLKTKGLFGMTEQALLIFGPSPDQILRMK